MNRLEEKLHDLKKRGRKALSVFLTAGYPNFETTEKLVLELEKCGVDFFEIGFPFSDPVADGPVIQRSSEAALKKGATWKKLMALARKIRKKSQVPLIFMSYANTLFCRGWKKSIRELKDAGFDASIIPDLIPDEEKDMRLEFAKCGLSLVYLCSPTTRPERIRYIARNSSGFVYCVSVAGVTGARKALPASGIRKFLTRVKKASRLPVMLGFGISQTRHLDAFQKSADGFVIGSALIGALDGASRPADAVCKARAFIRPFANRLKIH